MDSRGEVVKHKSSESQTRKTGHTLTRRAFLKSSALGVGAASFTRRSTKANSLEQDILDIEHDPLAVKEIDYVKTYGHGKPLTEIQLIQLNERFGEEEVEMLPNTYYASFVVSESTYAEFAASQNDVSLQRYVRDQVGFLDWWGTSFVPQKSQGAEAKIRQLIVVQDDVLADGELGVGSISFRSDGISLDKEIINNADSTYIITDAIVYIPPLLPEQTTPPNIGLLQNFANEILHVPDQRSLSVMGEDNQPAFEKVMLEWRVYDAADRPDIGDTFFIQDEVKVGAYAKLLLGNRLRENTVHDPMTLFEGGEIFSSRVPDTLTFSFGQRYGNTRLEVYKAAYDPDGDSKFRQVLENIVTTDLDKDGKCMLDTSVFIDTQLAPLVSSRDASAFFVRVPVSDDGEADYRWLDLRDILATSFVSENGNSVELSMMLNQDQSPQRFDWTIYYDGKSLDDIVSNRLNELSSENSEPEQPRDIEAILTPHDIDGLTTFGGETPLRQEELGTIINKLNSELLPSEEMTYYSTMFINQSMLEYFQTLGIDESFQEFLVRHYNVFNEVLSDPSRNGGVKNRSNVALRRLFVIEDGVMPPDQFFPRNEIADSDGGWFFRDFYNPSESSYWDKEMKIDRGLLHELGHSTLHLFDVYTLYTMRRDGLEFPEQLNNMPDELRDYDAAQRSDFGPSLMMGCDLRMGIYDSTRLERRINKGTVHHKTSDLVPDQYGTMFIAETGGMPYDIPRETILELGQDFSNAKIEVFRRAAPQQGSTFRWRLEKIQELNASSSGDLMLEKDKIFPQSVNGVVIPSEKCVFLMKVTDTRGGSAYRWMDIRDFNMAYWRGEEDQARLGVQLAKAGDTWQSFQWAPVYTREISKETNISSKEENGLNQKQFLAQAEQFFTDNNDV